MAVRRCRAPKVRVEVGVRVGVGVRVWVRVRVSVRMRVRARLRVRVGRCDVAAHRRLGRGVGEGTDCHLVRVRLRVRARVGVSRNHGGGDHAEQGEP